MFECGEIRQPRRKNDMSDFEHSELLSPRI